MRRKPGAGDCCAYNERKRLERAKNKRPKKKTKRTDECGKVILTDAHKEAKEKGHKVKPSSRKIRKLPKEQCPCAHKILKCLKPPYDERAKYLDVNHILCVLEEKEVLKIVNVRDLRENIKRINNVCDSDSEASEECEDSSYCGKAKTRARQRRRARNEKLKVPLEKHTCGRKLRLADEDCQSICSLDSKVDVQDYALTSREINDIIEHGKQARRQQEKEKNTDKCEGELPEVATPVDDI